MNTAIEKHYSRPELYQTILSAFEQAGIDKKNITSNDLAGVDQFHVRGLEVSKELAERSGLNKDMKVLDVGCGIGGPCRMLAEEYGCHTTGIDITEEFIRTATLLSELTGLQKLTRFIQANALKLPFDGNSFDLVWTQHVQMNIEDKQTFYAEIYRVLKQGGRFIYYDILATGEQPIRFPVPWADAPPLSFLATKDQLHGLLRSAGLEISETTDQTLPGTIFFETMLEKVKEQGAPPPGVQLVIGDAAAEKLGNVYRNLVEKKIELESGICMKA